ncbi:MAG: hypothetical protein II393_02265 [Cytophagales bacterium]|nr:hypothetical protein [Cytophagales bacterium]
MYEYEINNVSEADLGFIKDLIMSNPEIKIKKQWVSKFNNYLTMDEKPIAAVDCYNLRVTLSTNSKEWFDYLVYEYTEREMQIEDLKDLLQITMTKEQEGYDN